MPSLDLSDAFNESTFLDAIVVLRRQEIVSSKGRSTVSTSQIPTYANVDAASPDQLERLADAQFQGKTLSIVTKFRLRGVSEQGSSGYQPDVIQYNGDSYIVQLIDDYSRYGVGWIQALATSINFVDQSPENLIGASLRFNLPANSEFVACF